ncbi:SUKH-3 domain-containing protein [Actinoplanes sp. LDG1-06]|uniref:SUKH-3 domain-containing protein n=1 Tax=Paractinoplanes ovalisporus TaxID=2810368 RepID=A0ABS2AL50_9ACTN|nr:SUKH-3 domain-containing protein [Actinoplanes ovalisporus]MBM2620561.1 SUKH-3 domain-containing protein [Actinoplanes ovalisporus]
MESSDRLLPQTRRILGGAGWYSGRRVDTSRWSAELAADGYPPLHAAAVEFLAEFGGLSIPYGGSGISRAREAIALVPTLCDGEADRFIEWGQDIGHDLAPIGELAGGTCSWTNLGIDERGEIYTVIDGLATFGRMPDALDWLILGYMPRDLM